MIFSLLPCCYRFETDVHVHICCVVFFQDTMICTGCCATLDNIITFLFKKLTRQSKTSSNLQENNTFLRILEQHPDILQQVLKPHFSLKCAIHKLLLHVIQHTWNVSRLKEDFADQ
jgi:hypothetical protein